MSAHPRSAPERSVVEVRGVRIGEGTPKVIVPLTAADADELAAQATAALAAGPDLLEWRVDFLAGVDGEAGLERAAAAGRRLADVACGTPLLVTVRTAGEGGEVALADDAYVALYRALLDVADLIDVEILHDSATVATLVEMAHAAGVAVVGSSHDFARTPPQAQIEDRLALMAERGADILKIAVMPHDPGDVLTLLAATWETSRRTDRPLITMSMAHAGVVSRLAGGVFGSAATFGAVGHASAPGQVDAAALRAALALVHGG